MRPIRPALVPLALVITLAACSRDDGGGSADGGVAADAAEAIEAVEPATEPAGAALAIPPSGDSRMDGYGTLDFGMSAEEAHAGWNGNPLEPAGQVDDPMACHLLVPAGQPSPPELAFMFEDDLFVRYSVASKEITAPGGGRVGMDEAALQGLYGRSLQVMPHKYVEGGKVLLSREDAGGLPSQLAFELDADGRVTAWRVGMAPQVGYMEGCG